MKTCSSEIQHPLFSKLVIIAFAITFLIMGIKLVLLDPIIGLANNGDFWRNMSTVGLWFCDRGTMSDCQIPYEQMYFGFIIKHFFYGLPAQSGFWTPYVIVLSLSRSIAHLFSPLSYDIRFIGAINLLLYWSGVLTLISQIRVRKKLPIIVQVIIAIGLVIFVSDSYILQYFNSFYAEPISLINAIWFFVLFLAIANHKTGNAKYFMFLLQVVVGVFAASTKQQDSFIIFPLTAIVLIELFLFLISRNARSKFVSVLLGICVVIGMVGSVVYIANKNEGGDSTVAYNTIMNGLLPFSTKQEQLLTSIGFSASQAKELMPYIGQTAFENSKQSKYSDFFSQRGEIKIILADPAMLWKSLMARSKYLYTDVTYGNFQMIDNLPAYSKLGGYSRVWWQLTQILFNKSLAFYVFILMTSIVIGSTQLFKYGFQPTYLILVSLSLSNFLRFMVVILGDANEDAKHLFMVNIEFFVIFLLLIYCLIHLFKRSSLITEPRLNVLVDNSSRLQ